MIEFAYPDWQKMPRENLDELRTVFFAGAQHLFGSVCNILSDEEEPTEQDMLRMSLIARELEAFIDEWKARHGITDPDIGYHGPPETKQ